MRITTVFVCLLLCIETMAQIQPTTALACNLGAISSAERPRYSALAKRVKAAISESRELRNGYAFTIRAIEVSLPELAEWISFERLCCPFLQFQLQVSGQETVWHLTLTGPSGAKAVLEHEFLTSRQRG